MPSLVSITPEAVHRKANRLGIHLKRPRDRSCKVHFETTTDALGALRKVAYQRGMCIGQFCRLVCEMSVKRGLVDTILMPSTREPRRPGSLGGAPRRLRQHLHRSRLRSRQR